MSQDSKPHLPTRKRLDDSKKKGEVLNSQEVTTWFGLVGIAVFMLIAPQIFSELLPIMKSFIGFQYTQENDEVWKATQAATFTTLKVLILSLSCLLIAGVASRFVQDIPVISLEPLQMKLSKIDPLKGIKRVFSMNSIFNLIKSIAKVTILSSTIGFVLWSSFNIYWPKFQALDKIYLFHRLEDSSFQILLWSIAILSIVAIVDFLYQKQKYLNERKMSDKDLKDENKETQGNPQVKQKISSMQKQRALAASLGGLSKATVVITNPTHIAIALTYKPETMAAPVVVAKGKGFMAKYIKEFSKKLSIAMVENKTLARAMYPNCTVGKTVPLKYYEATANIIAYIMSQDKKASYKKLNLDRNKSSKQAI